MPTQSPRPPTAPPPDTATDSPGGGQAHWRRASVWLVVVLTLLAVFALYRRPDFLLTLADQVWSCF